MSDGTVDWSMAPADAKAWQRVRGACSWMCEPLPGANKPVRLSGAPDLMPWDGREVVILTRGSQP